MDKLANAKWTMRFYRYEDGESVQEETTAKTPGQVLEKHFGTDNVYEVVATPSFDDGERRHDIYEYLPDIARWTLVGYFYL